MYKVDVDGETTKPFIDMARIITAVICLISMTSFGQKETPEGMYLAPYISDKNHTNTKLLI